MAALEVNEVGDIFERPGRVSRTDAVLRAILDAANRTEEITSIASNVELFVQEYGLIAAHLRGLHRETGLVVIIKVGTSARENFWCRELHRHCPDLVPRVYAAGARLGELDVHWLASEAIPYGPLGDSWNGREFELMLDAGIRFYQQAKLIDDPTLNVTTLNGSLPAGSRERFRQRCSGCPSMYDLIENRRPLGTLS